MIHTITIRSLIRLKSKSTNLFLVYFSQPFVAFFQVVFVKNYSEPNVLYILNLYYFLSVEKKIVALILNSGQNYGVRFSNNFTAHSDLN